MVRQDINNIQPTFYENLYKMLLVFLLKWELHVLKIAYFDASLYKSNTNTNYKYHNKWSHWAGEHMV